MISAILALVSSQPGLAKKLHKELPYIKAEIYYAASHEGARSVDDVISRRTRIAFEAKNRGVDLAADIAGLIAPILGWSAKERRESVASYEDLVEREITALDELQLKEARVSS